MSVSSSLPVFWARQDSSSSFATLASVPWLKLHLLFHLNTTLYSLSTELITSQSYTSKSQPVPPIPLIFAWLSWCYSNQGRFTKVTLCKCPESSHQFRVISQLLLWILSPPASKVAAVQCLNSRRFCKFKSVWVDLIALKEKWKCSNEHCFQYQTVMKWVRCCVALLHGMTSQDVTQMFAF